MEIAMAAGCRTAMLLLALALSGMSPPAQAQPAPSNAVTSSSPATEQPAPSPQAGRANAGPDCHAPLPPVPPRGNQRMTVALTDASPGTRGAIWQPRGGEVSFTVTSADGTALGAMNIVACFRWHDGRDQNNWVASPVPLRVIAAAPGTITYGARVPDLPAVQSWWFARVLGAAEQEEFAGLWIVPIADFRVVATSDTDWKTLDTVVPVGVTSVAFSSLLALIGVLGAWFMLYSFGDRRGVPGRDVVLKLISTRNGYASLSQLQTLMWSFVVGAAGIYVMALSGNLIDISNGTLVLLGITGVAFVGSKLQSHIDDKARDPSAPQAAQPVTPAAPSAVAGLLPVPGGITDGEVRLTWPVPIGGGPPASYIVQYRLSGPAPGPWLTPTATITKPSYAVIGLRPRKSYEFQVAAVNAGGSGAFCPPLSVTTLASSASATPGQAAGLRVETDLANGAALNLTWYAVAGATGYRVQYRAHDSDEIWNGVDKIARTGTRLTGLLPNTFYDVRVAAMTGSSLGAWSAAVTGITGPRIPYWSDLIVAPAGGNTVDMARVQMLFFTVIGAVFVGLKVYTSNRIPDIPDGFLLLMGISNGVYLTAKAIPG
jgi:hypothetical protein